MKLALLPFALLLAFPGFAQMEMLTVQRACAFDDKDNASRDVYTFPGSEEAAAILAEVVHASVLEANFILRSGDCKNALATSMNGKRYIIYNTTFLENFKRDARTKWAAYCVLAHEVGHHLNGHDFTLTDTKRLRAQELEADKYAGGVLHRLGASLEEAQAGINTFALDKGSETHPPKSARLEAVAAGWKQAQEVNRHQPVPEEADVKTAEAKAPPRPGESAETWYERGKQERDINKKIECLDKAIALKPKYAEAYYQRGWAKNNLHLNAEAVKDFDQAILCGLNDTDVYNNRGLAKYNLGQFSEAIKDYEKAIKLDPKSGKSYCGKGCCLVGMKKYNDAIEWLNKGLRLNPNLTFAKDCLKEATSKL